MGREETFRKNPDSIFLCRLGKVNRHITESAERVSPDTNWTFYNTPPINDQLVILVPIFEESPSPVQIAAWI